MHGHLDEYAYTFVSRVYMNLASHQKRAFLGIFCKNENKNNVGSGLKKSDVRQLIMKTWASYTIFYQWNSRLHGYIKLKPGPNSRQWGGVDLSLADLTKHGIVTPPHPLL